MGLQDNDYRFHIRRVSKPTNIYVEDHAVYHDACLAADIARSLTGDHYVVWDTKLKLTLYDSRKLK